MASAAKARRGESSAKARVVREKGVAICPPVACWCHRQNVCGPHKFRAAGKIERGQVFFEPRGNRPQSITL